MPDLRMLNLGLTLLPEFLTGTPVPVIRMTLLPVIFLVSFDPAKLCPSTLSHWAHNSVESLDPTRLPLELGLTSLLSVESLDPTLPWPSVSSMEFLDPIQCCLFSLSVESLDLAQLWPSTLLHWAYHSVQYLAWSSVFSLF
jgi:hypothetical protein